MRTVFWTAFWVFLVDQATKYVVLYPLNLIERRELDVLPPFFNLRMAWNRGVNFGLFGGMDLRWVLVAIAFVIVGVVVWWMSRGPQSRLAYLSAGLLIGGAAGNVVDRIIHGAVADFINMSCCGISNPYAFNVADVGVFLGALGLVFFTGDPPRAQRRDKKA